VATLILPGRKLFGKLRLLVCTHQSFIVNPLKVNPSVTETEFTVKEIPVQVNIRDDATSTKNIFFY
jgi:hypothetical protein